MTNKFWMHDARRKTERPSRRASGYTLVSMVVTVVVAAIVLTGAWMTYIGYQAQWKVSNADRMMDQYAAASMQEMTNLLSWSWGAKEISGGRFLRWKFLIDDQVQSAQTMSVWESTHYHRDVEHFVELTYNPSQGILFNGQPPRWVRDNGVNTGYQWGGKPPVSGSGHGPGFGRIMDARDRITLESMTVDINDFRDAGFVPSQEDQARLQMVLKVEIVMHYTSFNPTYFGLYSRGYVRERRYSTEIAMRNWDVEHNDFRDAQVAAAAVHM